MVGYKRVVAYLRDGSIEASIWRSWKMMAIQGRIAYEGRF